MFVSPPAVPASFHESKEREELVEIGPRRVALKIPRGLVTPLVSSWPVWSWIMKRTLVYERVALEKERVRVPFVTEVEPRKEPM